MDGVDWAGLSFKRSEVDVKNVFTSLVALESPLTVRELDFNAERGKRGGSIVVIAGVGSQYRVEKGSMDFMV